jgi:hypothetical protein
MTELEYLEQTAKQESRRQNETAKQEQDEKELIAAIYAAWFED